MLFMSRPSRAESSVNNFFKKKLISQTSAFWLFGSEISLDISLIKVLNLGKLLFLQNYLTDDSSPNYNIYSFGELK